MENFNLQNKVAIITGSGRGIGAETALELARNGADIAVNDIDESNARIVKDKIEQLGRRALLNIKDISNHSHANSFVDEVWKTMGRVDILINNAGITRDSTLAKLSEEKWDEVIRVNLKGPFNMGQACAKYMKENTWGRIINLASVAWFGNIGQTNYSASKAGVVGLTRTWALELARHGITSNAVAPGLVESTLTQQIPNNVKEMFLKKIPVSRIGQPKDVARLILFLASEEASYITGQTIQIDGGLSVGF